MSIIGGYTITVIRFVWRNDKWNRLKHVDEIFPDEVIVELQKCQWSDETYKIRSFQKYVSENVALENLAYTSYNDHTYYVEIGGQKIRLRPNELTVAEKW